MFKKNSHNLIDICLKMKYPRGHIQVLDLQKEY